MNRNLKIAVLGLSISFLAACSTLGGGSPSNLAATAEPASTEAVSRGASGSACGIELFDFAKFGIWDRAERAYHAALTNAGAKALLAPTLSDSRIDLMVATVKCSQVSGTAIY